MVYWIRQADGSYTHDFTPFDKYLDLAEKTIGKPNMLRLNCWGEWGKGHGKRTTETAQWSGPSKVSLLDPETGKIEPLQQPNADTPEFVAFWKPVLTNALARIKKRGWLDVTALGHNAYCWHPHARIVDVAHEIWPEGVWAFTAHNGGLGMTFKGSKGIQMPVRYPEHIWGPGPGSRHKDGRGYRTLLKTRPGCIFHTMRNAFWDYSELLIVRSVIEKCISGGHDGVSDFGGDFFPVQNPNSPGRTYCLGNGRGTGGPNCSTRALLAPGPNGAIATERFEAFREGVQLCEAMLFVEKAIQRGTLSDALQAEANDVLNTRVKQMRRAHVLIDKAGRRRFSPTVYGETLVEHENNLFGVAAKIAAGGAIKNPATESARSEP